MTTAGAVGSVVTSATATGLVGRAGTTTAVGSVGRDRKIAVLGDLRERSSDLMSGRVPLVVMTPAAVAVSAVTTAAVAVPGVVS
ncbi:hypothetical protein PUR34_04430, partial [Streptomyces sp. JV185]